MQKGKILAIDYGLAAIGLAICDDSQQFVFGKGVLNPLKGLKPVFEKILKFCRDEQVQTVVVGLPLGSEGEETPQTARVRKFITKLEDFLKQNGFVPSFVFEDESFTSYEADKHLADLGLKGSQRKQYEDELAAILILKKHLKLL
ncbi:MAG: Holliday junction resolvase RuvX [Candidatus Gracilibacteria bacterium]|jgi:putative Holliday junction resolvase